MIQTPTVYSFLLLLQTIFAGGSSSTSLGDVYKGLVCGKLGREVDEWLADQTSEPARWAFPPISHADGFETYQVTGQTWLTLAARWMEHSITAMPIFAHAWPFLCMGFHAQPLQHSSSALCTCLASAVAATPRMQVQEAQPHIVEASFWFLYG